MNDATQLEESLQRDIDLIRARSNAWRSWPRRVARRRKALFEANGQLAYSVILRDKEVDELEKEIDRLCLEFLIRQQPPRAIFGSYMQLSKSTKSWSVLVITRRVLLANASQSIR